MSYNIGVDLSSSGALAITEGNKIIDIIKYPQPEYDKNAEKIIKAKIKHYEDEGKGVTKIKQLKAELKALKRHAVRNYKDIYDFILPYKGKINNCVLEEPLRQIGGFATSVDSIASNFTTLGVYKTIFSILEIPYKMYLPTQWHKFFPEYEQIGKCANNKEKREKVKEVSIKICREKFINADDFIMEKRHIKPNDNIAESAILSLIEIK